MEDCPLRSHFDWREQSVFGPIENQGTIGSCWAFAAKGCVEAGHAIKHNDIIKLSAQHIINCLKPTWVPQTVTIDGEQKNIKCYMSNPVAAYKFILNEGVKYDRDCQYVERKEICEQESSLPRYKIESFQKIPYLDEMRQFNELGVMRAVTRQPVSAAIRITEDLLLLRGSEILRGDGNIVIVDNKQALHAVIVCGFGTSEDGVNFWSIRNSWGQTWADQGYGKIIRNSSQGPNQSSLLQSFSYPIIFT